jgi:DNA-binding GntR family transcriptional regulator
LKAKYIHKTISTVVAQKIREDIRSGKLPPGRKVLINQLSDRFKCSVTPIREALSTLHGEGLLLSDRHKAMTVAKLDKREVEEIFEVRCLLDSYAVGLAVHNLDSKTLRKLTSSIEEQENCVKEKNYSKWFKLNYEFHHEIIKLSKQITLIEMIKNLRARLSHYTRTFDVVLDRCDIALSEHKQILNALSHRDEQKAKYFTEQHLKTLAKCLCSYLEKRR